MRYNIDAEVLRDALERLGTIQAVSDELNIPYITVMRIMDRYSIPRHHKTSLKVSEFLSKSQNDLNLILSKYKTCSNIASAFNLSTGTVRKAYKKANINLPNKSETRRIVAWSNSKRPPKEELISAFEKYKTVNAIAKSLSVDNSSVSKWFDSYGINRPSLAESVRAAKNISIPMSKELYEILDGLVLSDGSLVKSGRNTASFQLGTTNLEYAEVVHKMLSDNGLPCSLYFTTSNGFGKKYKSYSVRSKTTLELGEFWRKWYPNDTKIIPKNINNTNKMWLWEYIGDGCLYKNAITLATSCFSKEDVEYLSSLLAVFEIDSHVKFERQKYYHLMISERNTKRFLKLIGPTPIEYYKYKWELTERPKVNCKICNKEFVQVHGKHICCSKLCLSRYSYKRIQQSRPIKQKGMCYICNNVLNEVGEANHHRGLCVKCCGEKRTYQCNKHY